MVNLLSRVTGWRAGRFEVKLHNFTKCKTKIEEENVKL
jgi:hypothetical protein